ncbi:MAG: helix-turn-helix domain-containing protein [Myroides sp.]
MSINYKRIFQDILDLKFPEKKELRAIVLEKEINDFYDVLSLHKMIFGDENKVNKHKSYDPSTITKVLKYQQENKLSNIETAQKFNLSRNTVSAFKKRVGFNNTAVA